MPRPIAFDVTHLVSRMAARAVTGIDRIDLAYGRHFATAREADAVGAFCSPSGPRIMAPPVLRRIVAQAEEASGEHVSAAADPYFTLVKDWLAGRARGKPARGPSAPSPGAARRLSALYWQAHCRWMRTTQTVPRGGVYLNVAEHWLEYPRHFSWLGSRPDVEAVFFVHDLLPFDYPEYFRPGYEAVFRRRFETLARRGTAFIVSTNVVRERLGEALAIAGRRAVPIHVASLPSPLALAGVAEADEPPPARPFFLLVSTIEPRKNHLLVLNLWRELMGEFGEATPRLVLVGSRGWENEQVIDMLDRCEGIADSVLRLPRVSRRGLVWLMTHAQALLMPSFDEGYGLPLVEALSLGTPVIAADTPTFREVTRGCATLLSAIDGLAWRDAVIGLTARGGPGWQQAQALAAPFRPPGWANYFSTVDEFIHALP